MNLEEAIQRIQWASTELPNKQAFKVHDGNRRAVEQCAMWAFRLPEYDGDPKRGIELQGEKGTGKTHLMRCISLLIRPYGFETKKCDDIVQDFNNSGSYTVRGERGNKETKSMGGDQIIEYYANLERICFDDLGDERPGNYYGQVVNVMERILVRRGDLMASKKLLTMITTNFNRDAQLKKYGERMIDRRDLMLRPFVVKPDPSPEAVSFRKDAVVLDWRGEVEEKPRDTVSAEVVSAGINDSIESLANKKNERLKEEILKQEKKKQEYMASFRHRILRMDIADLTRAAQFDQYAEARALAKEKLKSLHRTLGEIQRETEERLAAQNQQKPKPDGEEEKVA